MSATDPQVLTTEVKVPGGQGSQGGSNMTSIPQPQPNPVGLGPTQLSPQMEGFYAIVELQNIKFSTMVEAGYIIPGDLVYLDKSVINQLSIRLSSKA